MHRPTPRLTPPRLARSARLASAAALATVALGLAGCATPRHSNTLIFGTTTKVALDVSQEPTGSMGITLGYKRQEAVWMPLIANKSDTTGKLVPSECQGDKCRKLQGTAGQGGGAAGPGAVDTYSVLATFSGDMGSSAKSVEAKGSVAQYFATGFAARLLAQNGGAAAVSSGAKSPAEANAQAGTRARAAIAAQDSQIKTLLDHLAKPDGSIDAGKLSALLAAPKANEVDAPTQKLLKDAKTRAALRDELEVLTPVELDHLHQALPKT